MALALNKCADADKQKMLNYVGDTDFRDDLCREGSSFQDFVLSAAQMDTLNATPVTLLAAPGSGLTNLVSNIYLKVNSTGLTAFELGSGVLEIRYTDGSGAKVVTDITNAIVESATDVEQYLPGIVVTAVSNAAIVAHTSTDVTAGTGSISGRIYYRTVKASEIVA
jgi:hypothetical protein